MLLVLIISDFNQNRGHWILTDAAGHEDTSGKVATLTTDRTGKVSLNAKAPGTIYLEYVIDENCYATASNQIFLRQMINLLPPLSSKFMLKNVNLITIKIY